jgi:hypothetical protein
MASKHIYSVEEYFREHTFVIPYYQRGYKWSLLKNKNGKIHLKQLLDDLKQAFEKTPEQDYHLQGITVQEQEKGSVLVDGQQRTTSLFLMLLYLAKKDLVQGKLDYRVRGKVKEWIVQKFEFSSPHSVPKDESPIQDIAAFDAAWKTISEFQFPQNKEDFTNFLLKKVKLIYVVLNTDPEKVFSMMNKDKAEMTQTELIKAKLLSEASRQAFADFDTNDEGTHEWQINHLRSHFSREWDSWRKWWEENYKFLNKALPKPEKGKLADEPELSRLLHLFWHSKLKRPGSGENLMAGCLLEEYEKFIQDGDKDQGNKKTEAVETFEGVRQLQKILEEWFANPQIYNWIGLMTHGAGAAIEFKIDKVVELLDAYQQKNEEDRASLFQEHYRETSLLRLKDSNYEDATARVTRAVEQLKGDVYHRDYELAAQQLLRRNVQMLNNYGLKFDFAMYSPLNNAAGRSLEHIHAQSNFFTEEERKGIDKSTVAESETVDIDMVLGNSIGNLALVPKGFNSKLSDHPFKIKKGLVFNALQESKREKRALSLCLHTISLFAKSKWEKDDAEQNKGNFIKEMKEFYLIEEKDGKR